MHGKPIEEEIEGDDFTTLPKEARHSYIQDGLFSTLLTSADLEIKHDEQGEQWIFSDKGGPVCYGAGETPQAALDDYIKAVQMRVKIRADHIAEEQDEEVG